MAGFILRLLSIALVFFRNSYAKETGGRASTGSWGNVSTSEYTARPIRTLYGSTFSFVKRSEQAQLACEEYDENDGIGTIWAWNQAECTPSGKSFLIQCEKVEDVADSALVGDLQVIRRYCDTLAESCFEYQQLDKGRSIRTAMCVANGHKTHYTTSKYDTSSCSDLVTFEKPRGLKTAKLRLIVESSDLFGRTRVVPELFFQDWSLGLPGEKFGRQPWSHTSETVYSFSSAQFVVKFCARVGQIRNTLIFPRYKIKGAGIFDSI